MIEELRKLTAAGNERTKRMLQAGQPYNGSQGSYIGILEYYVALMGTDNPDLFQDLLEELKDVERFSN